MSNLRPGQVISMRVSPEDCMSTLDVVRVAGVDISGMSFPQMVSLAYRSLLQTMRDQGIIPTRDGFEYLEMMGPYIGTKQDRRKLQITDTINKAGSKVRVAGLSKPAHPPMLHAEAVVHAIPAAEPEEVPLEVRQARRRLTELLQKKDLADQEGSGIVWSGSDQREYDEVFRVVYPEG